MRVTAVDLIPYALPFEEPYLTARGRLERREMILVRLRTDEAVEGLGEAVPFLRGGPSLTELERELRQRAAPALLGMELDPDRPRTENPSLELLAPQVGAAIEIARLDLEARLRGERVWQALGAQGVEPVPCNATLAAGDPAAVAERASHWAERGFTTFKLKAGLPGDVRQVEAVRASVGPHARIRVDANGAWSPQEAALRIAGMERWGLELVEQPAPSLEDLALVRGQTAVPIAADESVSSAADARRAVELGACQLATAKLAKTGGITGARAIASHLPTYLSSALDGPVGIAAAAHVAQALREPPRYAQGLATQLLFSETVASRGCELEGPLLRLPEGPGLGVELDDATLARHRL